MNISTSTYIVYGVMGIYRRCGFVENCKDTEHTGSSAYAESNDYADNFVQPVQSKCSKENGFYKNFN